MKTLIRIIYALTLLTIGSLVSWYLVGLANSNHSRETPTPVAETMFVDHIAQLESYFDDFKHREQHFHATTERVYLPLDQQSSCLTCHTLFPHDKDPRRRAFNNQHTHFLSCLACHLKPELVEHAVFRWTDFGEKNSITRQGGYGLNRDGEGRLSGSNNFISRIVPVLFEENSSATIFTPYGDRRHKAYREDLIRGKDVDKEAFRAMAEENVGPRALGCRDCHSVESDFPWSKLGFDKSRVEELTESSVVGMVEDYEGPFYFPPAE